MNLASMSLVISALISGKNIRVTSARWLLMWLKSRFNRQPMFNELSFNEFGYFGLNIRKKY